MKHDRIIWLLVVAFSLTGQSVFAAVTLASLYTDNMVLQRDVAPYIWGKADPGEKVTVEIAGQTIDTTADSEGNWSATLKPLAASFEPVPFSVKGQGKAVVLANVVVGDVWICGGQSNMWWPLKKSYEGKEAVAEANHPDIRLFNIKSKKSFYKLDSVVGEWKPCTPESVKDFTAAGYYFGVDIQKVSNVPVGLIEMAYSGTVTQAWSSLEALQTEPSLKDYAKIADYSPESIKTLTKDYYAVVEPRYEQEMEAYKQAKADKVEPRPARPAKARPPESDPNLPSVLYNGMVHPIIPFPIKGLLWYQGGSNGRTKEESIEYATLLPNFFRDLRQRWGQGNFPIVYVQHAGWRPNRALPYLFEAQRLTLSSPNTAMVTTVDVGEKANVHPVNKKTVGERLAQAAAFLAYGKDVVPMGPMFKDAKVEDNKIRISFDYTGSGLMLGQPPLDLEFTPKPPKDVLAGFEVAGVDEVFYPAEAEIDGEDIIVMSDEVSKPVYVRYGWDSWPEVNLYNKEGLPASPFTSLDYTKL